MYTFVVVPYTRALRARGMDGRGETSRSTLAYSEPWIRKPRATAMLFTARGICLRTLRIPSTCSTHRGKEGGRERTETQMNMQVHTPTSKSPTQL